MNGSESHTSEGATIRHSQTLLGWLVVMAAAASARLGLSAFALALLLAGAEPEELATVVTASARGVDGVAFGDVIGANGAIVTVALGVGALVTSMPFGPRIRRYGLGGLAAAAVAGPILWDGTVSRVEGAVLVAGYVIFVASIWRAERQPPALGETAELDQQHPHTGPVGRELTLVLIGLVGTERGHVWIDDRANDGGIYPAVTEQHPERMTFTHFYEDWITRANKFLDDGQRPPRLW